MHTFNHKRSLPHIWTLQVNRHSKLVQQVKRIVKYLIYFIEIQ